MFEFDENTPYNTQVTRADGSRLPGTSDDIIQTKVI